MIRHSLFDFFGLNEKVLAARDGVLTLEHRQVTDFLCQYGANPFGGVDPRLATRVMDFFSNDAAVLCQPLQAAHALKLRTRLLDICGYPGGDALLTQSGAETVELAVKVARASTGRPFTIALGGAFHGKTTGAVQLTANEDYSRYFGVTNSFVRRLEVGPLAELEASFAALVADGKVNAVIVEVVQGEGGMIAIAPDWLRQLQGLCKVAGVLFIVDEIQTGLGRTGHMLASTGLALAPDMVLLSKALGGGIVPIGACVMKAGLLPLDFTIFHSSTFTNNNFTAFVGHEALNLLQEALPHARELGQYLGDALSKLVARHADVYAASSGIGLMRGLHMRPTHDSQSLLTTFQWNSGLRSYAIAAWLLREQNLLSMPCFSKPSCLRLQPPLNATTLQIDRGIEALDALAELLRAPEVELALMGEPVTLVTRARTAPPAPHRKAPKTPRPLRRFQFNMHPLHDWSFLNSMPEGTQCLGTAAQARYSSRIHELSDIFSGFAAECLAIPDLTLGDVRLEGRLYGVNLTASQMMELSARERQKIQKSMVNSAMDYGAHVMGLGGFTSIVTHPGLRRLDTGASVTSGSSLTAYAAVHAALNEPDLKQPEHFGIVGANGSVGGLCAQMLIRAAVVNRRIDRLTLFFNPHNPNGRRNLAKSLLRSIDSWQLSAAGALEDRAGWQALREIAQVFSALDVAGGVQRLDRAPAQLDHAIAQVLGRSLLDIRPFDDWASLKKVDRLLLATNSTTELSALHHCRDGAKLYDIGMPASVSVEIRQDRALHIVTAGVVRGPHGWTFGRGNMVELPPGVMLGCFAETMTLAATDPAAAPVGVSITLAEAERIGALARSVGLLPTSCAISESLPLSTA
jgi:acetylornithine/succinyldiaminopimelate/putrescine aminotransferase/predicted amino acid dehydrogenase